MKSTIITKGAVIAAVAAATLFLGQMASADTITVTSYKTKASALELTVAKNGSYSYTITDAFTVKNNSGGAQEITGLTASADENVNGGTPQNWVENPAVSGGSCLALGTGKFTNGATCTVDVTFTVSGYGKIATAMDDVYLQLMTEPWLGTTQTTLNGGKSYVQITTFAPTPEPGSLILFGTGALGLAGILRRKRSRA